MTDYVFDAEPLVAFRYDEELAWTPASEDAEPRAAPAKTPAAADD
jgi:hypothetical protein